MLDNELFAIQLGPLGREQSVDLVHQRVQQTRRVINQVMAAVGLRGQVEFWHKERGGYWCLVVKLIQSRQLDLFTRIDVLRRAAESELIELENAHATARAGLQLMRSVLRSAIERQQLPLGELLEAADHADFKALEVVLLRQLQARADRTMVCMLQNETFVLTAQGSDGTRVMSEPLRVRALVKRVGSCDAQISNCDVLMPGDLDLDLQRVSILRWRSDADSEQIARCIFEKMLDSCPIEFEADALVKESSNRLSRLMLKRLLSDGN